MLRVNASTAAQRATETDHADAAAAIEGDIGGVNMNGGIQGDHAVAAAGAAAGAAGGAAGVAAGPYVQPSAPPVHWAQLGWSRVVTLRYEHGASRDGAMHELRRPNPNPDPNPNPHPNP